MTTTLATQPDTAVADLVLVRMSLPGKKAPAPSTVREDIGKLLDSGLPAAEFDELRNELAAAGFLSRGTRNSYALTDAGRQRALRYLGIAEFPARANWSTVITKHLLPRATGLSPGAAAKLDNGEKLAVVVLKRKYGLSVGAGSTINQVLEAVVCKELGHPEETTLQGLLRTVVSRMMRAERLEKKTLIKQLPLFETGLSSCKADAVRRKLVREWLRPGAGASTTHEPSPPPPQPEPGPSEPFDLPAFARTVRALAASSPPEDRFHDNKVFIAALWRASQRESNFPRFSLPQFKQHLIEANSQNLLHLTSADFIQAMDPQLVADSATAYLNATFHFVLVEERFS